MADSITLLNSIRESIGGDYATRIPVATREKIVEVGNAILAYQPHTNAFYTQLLNRIAKSVITHVDEMEDIYAGFKSEELPFGDTIQKIFVDIVESQPFVGVNSLNHASFIKPEKGTIHVEYLSVDRKLFYKVTVSVAELKEAFLTVDKLDDFIMALTGSMTRSYAVDRYIMTSHALRMMSSLVLDGYLNGNADDSGAEIPVNALIVPESVAKYNNTTKEIEWATTGAKEFLKELRIMSRGLKFYHKLGYGNADDVDAALTGGWTDVGVIKAVKTPVRQQVVALEVPTMANIDVDALAVLFHMEKADIETRMIELEEGVLGNPLSADESASSTAYYIGGFICDKDAVIRCKSYEDSESFKNPEELYVNYWQHHWGFIAVSKFADFVPIVFKTYTPTEGD